MARSPLWLVAAVCLLGSAAAAQSRTTPPPTVAAALLTVHIETPGAGLLDGDLTTALSAAVSDARVRTAVLTVNGLSYEVPVRDGRVEQNVVVVPGNNRVSVSVTRGATTAHDAVTFHLRGPRVELIALLGWASRGEIIDLWTREPSGETCKWDHRETASGGRLLDFSTDAIGFGSQAYVLPEVRAGRYRVKVHYWSAAAWDDERGGFSYDEAIERLDALEAELLTVPEAGRAPLLDERRTVERRLDRWATPAAPQTPVHGEIVVFPNTTHERRWRFDRIPQRTGELVTLGEVEVSAEMIRAARAEVRP